MNRMRFLFSGDGAMAGRYRAMAWDQTPLGPAEDWDPARTLLYNDGYAEITKRRKGVRFI